MPRVPRARLPSTGLTLVCLGLLAVVLATYLGSLTNAPVSDDRALVVDNPYLRSISGLLRLWTTDLSTASALGEPSPYYRPIAMTTFWVNVAIGGTSAASLRLGNVFIHAANAMLLALFGRKATGLGWKPVGLAALLFAVAPVCSEPVLWISGRFDLLVVTFAFLALLAGRKEGRIGLATVLVSVAAGLLCKESFTGWLPLLVLDDVLVRRVAARRHLAKYVAIAAITAAYFGLRKIVDIRSLDAVTDTGVRAFAASFLFLVGTFLRELVWPTTLDPFRSYIVPPAAGLAAIAATLAALVAAPLVALRRDPGSTRARVAVFGVSWFVLATLPSAVVGPKLAMVGDRYAYLPLVGLFVAATTIAGWLEKRDARVRLLAGAFASTIALASAIVTRLHARDWRDDNSLAVSSLASNPENAYALYFLGSEAAQQGQLQEADALLARSMAANPRSWRTWNAVCYLRLHQDRLPEAEQACRETIGLFGLNPRAWVNLASVYVRAQRWNDALSSADRAVALKPRFAEAHYLAGVSAANLGLYPLAASHVAAGLSADGSHPRLLVLQSELERYKREHPAP